MAGDQIDSEDWTAHELTARMNMFWREIINVSGATMTLNCEGLQAAEQVFLAYNKTYGKMTDE